MVHEVLRQQVHGRPERGREQQGLPPLRQQFDDACQLVGKTGVEQAVGFIQHQHGHVGRPEGVALDQVQQAARRGHHHVRTAAQTHHLRVDRHAAEHAGHLHRHRQVARQRLERGRHLDREFARGHQHQRTSRPPVAGRSAFQPLQERQRKRRRLAGPGLRRSDDVAALQDRRDGGRLDGGGPRIAALRHRAHERGREPECGERCRRWRHAGRHAGRRVGHRHSRLALTALPFTLPAFRPRNASFAMPRSTAT
jgi:hypothetical protein